MAQPTPREDLLHNFEQYIGSLVGANPNAGPVGSYPAAVVGVDVDGTGADQTNHSLLEHHIKPLLNAKNVTEVVRASDTVQRALYSLGIYQDVAVTFEQAVANPNQLIAKIDIPSVKRFAAQTGTNFGNGEGSGYIKGSVKNYFGLGEIFTLDTSIGTRTKTSHLVNVAFPMTWVLPLNWKGEILGYASEKAVEWASHKEQVRGATARVSSPNHSFGLDAVLRSLYVTRPNSGNTIRDQAGHAFKLAAFYNWALDTRDNAFIPSSGQWVKVTNEIAAGDNPFYKTQLDYQKGLKLNDYVTGSFGVKLGALFPLFGSTSHVMDRFYLGGPLDIRGFRMNKVGPQDHGDSVGGETVAAAGLSIFTRLPKVKSDNIKLHLFANAGSLLPLDTKDPVGNINRLLTYPSTSVGIGMLYAHQVARFELNIAFPLTAHAGEGTHKGLQFGVGLNFL